MGESAEDRFPGWIETPRLFKHQCRIEGLVITKAVIDDGRVVIGISEKNAENIMCPLQIVTIPGHAGQPTEPDHSLPDLNLL